MSARRSFVSALGLASLLVWVGNCGPTETVVSTPVPAPTSTPESAVTLALLRTCAVDAPPVVAPGTSLPSDEVDQLIRASVEGPSAALLAEVDAVARHRHAAWQRWLADPKSRYDDDERPLLASISVETAVSEAQANFSLSYRSRAIRLLGIVRTPAALAELERVAAGPDLKLRRLAVRALKASHGTPKPAATTPPFL